MLNSLTNSIYLFCINKYLRRPAQQQVDREDGENMVSKLSPDAKEYLLLAPGMPSSPTTRAVRSEFSHTTATAIYPNTRFTNHESIPSLPNAFTTFVSAFPAYTHSGLPDRIRETDYGHLATHIPFDYSGFGLFSNSQTQSITAASSRPPPFFDICYKPASLNDQLDIGKKEPAIESALKMRIMDFLRISKEDYNMVCTANTTAAFKLLAESYPFNSNKRLLTVYDHDSEAIRMMEKSAVKRGAKVSSASFSWPSMRINGTKLKNMMSRRSKKQSGLFVFPLESRVSGARYPYLWMRIAQENGWHVVLDASALGPKEMDTLGLSLFRPEFIVCNFFKVFGRNPSGFTGLFIRRGSVAVLDSTSIACTIGVISIIPARSFSRLTEDYSDTESLPTQQNSNPDKGDADVTTAFQKASQNKLNVDQDIEKGSTSFDRPQHNLKLEEGDAITASYDDSGIITPRSKHIECRGLDHLDSMGLLLIRCRMRCITNWLVIALTKLRHPDEDKGHSLVKIYGPRVKYDRAPALAFNVFDWKGEKVAPPLVQKLADRSNISVSCGFLHNMWFADKYRDQKDAVMERRVSEIGVGCRRGESMEMGISVVSVSLSFMSSFEDAYGLWAFVAKFLDADFVEKERCGYVSLNQELIEV